MTNPGDRSIRLTSHDHAIPPLDRRGLRDFGLGAGAMIAGVFGLLLPWLFGAHFPRWPWIAGGAFAAAAIVMPAALRPVYRGWMRVALLLGRITTPLILGLVFYVAVTPMGVLMRIFGYDPMRRRRDPDARSYRVASTELERERLERPF